jgi:hypothetical protein
MSVQLAVVPHEARHLVIIGTSLRKPANILAAYLQSLAWQVVPRTVELAYVFVDDGLEPDARALLDEFVAARQGQVLSSGQPPTQDWTDSHPVTHQWSDSAMARVGRHKDVILETARNNRAEAVWFCDADLIMDPMTLTDLWSIPEQIVCAVYWTRWQKTPSEQTPVHAGPQVWQRHPYELSGNGYEDWELRRELIDRQIVHVYGQGACTLIRREALMKGVSFAPVPGNTAGGLMQGEDRHFCIRAEQLHIRMVATGWPDIFHIYHRPEDEALIPEMVRRLMWPGRWDLDAELQPVHAEGPPHLGDLVSLKLRALEPVATQQGRMYAPPQLVRGRVGRLTLHPELEDAVLSMERGEVRVVPVHFGLDYPFGEYRGQRRLIEVTLIDHKPMGYPPVVEDELIVNQAGSAMDQTNLTPEVIDLMREVHA